MHYPSGERGVAEWFVVVGRQGWQGASKNCVPCYIPIENIVHPELAVVLGGLSCFICGEKK